MATDTIPTDLTNSVDRIPRTSEETYVDKDKELPIITPQHDDNATDRNNNVNISALNGISPKLLVDADFLLDKTEEFKDIRTQGEDVTMPLSHQHNNVDVSNSTKDELRVNHDSNTDGGLHENGHEGDDEDDLAGGYKPLPNITQSKAQSKRPPPFKNVDEFLGYVLHRGPQLTADRRQMNQKNRMLMRTIAGKLMAFMFEKCPQCSRYIHSWGNATVNKALDKILRRISSGHYVFRFYVGDEIRKNDITVIHEGGCDRYGEQIQLQMSQNIPRVDRMQRQSFLQEFCDTNEYISPAEIARWFLPAFRLFTVWLGGQFIKGYKVHSIPVQNPNNGLSLMLTCTSWEDGEITSLMLDVELAVYLPGFPTTIALPNPIPSNSIYSRLGWGLLKTVKAEMDERRIQLIAFTKFETFPHASSSSFSNTPTESLPELKTGLTLKKKAPRTPAVVRTRSTGSSRKKFKPSAEVGVRNIWHLDYSEAELRLFYLVSEHFTLEAMEDAIKIYNTVSHCGKLALPEMDDNLCKVCKFWMVKKKSNKIRSGKEWLVAIVEFMTGVCEKGFCPSPSKSNVNVSPYSRDKVSRDQIKAMKMVLKYINGNSVLLLSHATGIYNGFCITEDQYTIPE